MNEQIQFDDHLIWEIFNIHRQTYTHTHEK